MAAQGQRWFFLRARLFFNFATYLVGVSTPECYWGRSLHAQSHRDSFLALFCHCFSQGLSLLANPEAVLSPQRQLAFLRLFRELTAWSRSLFIIATLALILLAYPGAMLDCLSANGIGSIVYCNCSHVQLIRNFMSAPKCCMKLLLDNLPDLRSTLHRPGLPS
jgi:predicted ATPase